jgi:succinoglycan biosynthesis protein ExoO
MDNTIPDISVVIASYNVERYIENAISSALNQQGVNVEVIVVDDCSTDDTWQVICENTDPRVKYIRLESNKGPSVARNTAIALATGKWLAILDGDDIFLPNRLARCLATANKNNAYIVVDNLLIYKEMDKNKSTMFPTNKFAALGNLTLAIFISGMTTKSNYTLGYLKPLFSLDFLRKHKIMYDANLRIGEDYIFMAEALANGAVCVVEPTAGYQYTVRAGSISHRLSIADINRIVAADNKFIAKYSLDAQSIKAQRKREEFLKKEYYHLMQINALKQKNIIGFLRLIWLYPIATPLLLRTLHARIKRIISSKQSLR